MKQTLSNRVRLGVFEIDLRAGELRQGDGAVLLLPDQPLQILRMLIDANGEIVSREEIRRRLWPDDTVVEFDHSINTAIKKLRRALVDSGDEPHYIGTVAKRGYRLLIPVERHAPDGDLGEETSGTQVNAGLIFGTRVSSASEGDAAANAAARLSPLESKEARAKEAVKPRARFLGAAVFVAVASVAVVVVLYWRMHHTTKLTEQDTIVLADFDNKTGDPVFDDSLKQALAAQLSQSPFLNVLPNRKVRGPLKELNRSANEPLTLDLSREICRQAGSKAVVAGSISHLYMAYILELKAVECGSGNLLAEAQERSPDKATVLKALDEAAVAIRKQMGEPVRSVQKYAAPLAEATTPSLEAWKAYSMGKNADDKEGMTAALPLYKRALEIDPNFAKAYYSLSIAYGNLNQRERSEEYGRKAYELRNKVNEHERLAIDANYYANVTGELEKAAQVYEQWHENYPRDASAIGNLGGTYGRIGYQEKFLEASRQALRLNPSYGAIYYNVATAYMNLNRLDDAEAAFKQAQEHNVSIDYVLPYRYLLAFLKGNSAQMTQLVTAADGDPGAKDVMLASQADTEAWYGKFRNARKLTGGAMDSAKHNDATETAAGYQVAEALREAATGNWQQAHADALAAVKLSHGSGVQAMAALALAQAGDATVAEEMANELNKARPLDTLVQRYWLPTIRAAVALKRNDPAGAVQMLSGMGTLEMATVNVGVNVYLCPVYVRAEAYLMLGDGKSAEAEFQKIIEHYGLVANFPWGALARLGLARAYALEAANDPAARDRARSAYQNFLTLWKDADPDILIYKQAKAEYAKLQ